MTTDTFRYLTPEAQARVEIDRMLRLAGWADKTRRICDRARRISRQSSANLQVSRVENLRCATW
jgi:hypothetical protein